MGEQAQRHKKIEDNPHYQNRERDQRGEDHDVWRIAGGIGHGVIHRAWAISVRGTSTTRAPKSIWFRSGNRMSERIDTLINDGTNQVDGARGSRHLAQPLKRQTNFMSIRAVGLTDTNLQCLAGTAPVTKRSGKKIAREQFGRSPSPRVASQPFEASIHDV